MMKKMWRAIKHVRK